MNCPYGYELANTINCTCKCAVKKNGTCNCKYFCTYTENKPLKINGADGRYYEVWYVAVDGSATVKHPTNYAYTVSGTNDGGVVVTVDRSKALEAETEETAG